MTTWKGEAVRTIIIVMKRVGNDSIIFIILFITMLKVICFSNSLNFDLVVALVVVLEVSMQYNIKLTTPD